MSLDWERLFTRLHFFKLVTFFLSIHCIYLNCSAVDSIASLITSAVVCTCEHLPLQSISEALVPLHLLSSAFVYSVFGFFFF